MRVLVAIMGIAIFLPVYGCVESENSMPNTVRNDIEVFETYVRTPLIINAVDYELIIKPEPGGVPAPTDWVALAAIIETDEVSVKNIDATLPVSKDCGLASLF